MHNSIYSCGKLVVCFALAAAGVAAAVDETAEFRQRYKLDFHD